jgi:hypothetical protein
MNRDYRVAFAILGCVMITSCASKAPVPKLYDASRPTDGDLTCEATVSEVSETNNKMRDTAKQHAVI